MNHHVAPRLQREHVHCPITALAFFRPPGGSGSGPAYVLSGEDTHLNVYDAGTQRLRASVRVFADQPVQGISCSPAGEESSSSSSSSEGDVLVWGGPLVTVLPASMLAGLLRNEEQGGDCRAVRHDAVPDGRVLRAPDWVYHGAVCPQRPGLAAVVTAHNEVIPLLRTGGGPADGGWRLGRLRSPPSRPILYSAQVRWTSGGEVLVAAGTVFGEIIVWKCRVVAGGGGEEGDNHTEEEAVEVLHVFTGHEGSIFGVDFSPEVVVDPRTGEVSRLLVSCSDDRTIRVWSVSDADSSREGGPSDRAFTEARETGFGENSTTTELEAMANHHSAKALAVAMGHVSRIWSVRISPQSIDCSSEGTLKSLTLYSFGEDATAQKWKLNFDVKSGITPPSEQGTLLMANLTHEATFHNHDGKHIWSSALHFPAPSSPGKELLVTGGSDGKIQLIEETLTPSGEDPDSSVSHTDPPMLSGTHSADEISSTAHQPAGNETAESEPLQMYGLPSANSVVATTSSGQILTGSLNASGLSWKPVSVPKPIRDDLRKYQTVRSAGPDVTLIGSPSGQLYVFGNDIIRPVVKLPRKIAEIFILPLEAFQGLGFRDAVSGQVPIIVTVVGSPEVRLMLLDPAKEDIVLNEASIELEKGFIPTAAGICQDIIVFGSRTGALSLHRLDQSGGGFRQVAYANRPGSKDAVSSIVSLPAKPGLPCPYFLTTSRDGRYRIYEKATPACGPDDAVTVHLRHEAVPPLGPIIESALFTTTTTADAGAKPQLILCGFRSREFVVWNETTQQELASVECGGGHRAFTYHVDPADPGRLSFIWTKASRTCVHTQDGVTKRALRPGGHGREIKAVAASAQGGFLATGAEDTNIRIWRVNDKHGGARKAAGLRCLAVVERHTTGIQCLRWAGENYLVSSSGGEELFVWRVAWLGDSAYEGIAVLCEGVYPDKTRDGDLRIMSFDVQIMDPACKGEEQGGEVLCLSLVLSNSTLKTYRYSEYKGFTLLAQGRYTGACLLQIRHLSVQPGSDGLWDLHVLTASTDGHVALWKATELSNTPEPPEPAHAQYELLEAQRLHQSSIKALDLRALPHDATSSPSSYAVFTGGDDNAIGHVRLGREGAGDFKITYRSLVNGAHAAAITGLCVAGVEGDCGPAGPCRVRLCTASNDQRVRSWVVAIGEGGAVGRASLVGDGYSAVADCGDLEQLGGGKFVVAGVGMELWTV